MATINLNKEEIAAKDRKEIKRSIEVLAENFGTYVVVVVYSKDDNKHQMFEIPAKRGRPLTIGSYNRVRDSFHEMCVDYHIVGLIPIGYQIAISGNGSSPHIEIPLPPAVIARHLSPDQEKSLKLWKSKYKGPEFYFDFLQLRSIY